MNFKVFLTIFQKWSIVVKIALNEVCRDGVDLVLACLILYPMEEAIESTKNERVFTAKPQKDERVFTDKPQKDE